MTTKDLQSLYARTGFKAPHEFAKPDASKYNARKKAVDGHIFDSTNEALAYSVLKLWERSGAIKKLELQPLFVLQEGFRDTNGKWNRPIKYVADFRFESTDPDDWKLQTKVVDVKGFPTAAFLIKAKMFRSRWPTVDLQIWNRDKVKELSRI